VVVKNVSPGQRIDDETPVRIVKEADLGEGETIRVYEIETEEKRNHAANE